MTYYARRTGNLCGYFNDFRATDETVVSGLPPSEITFEKAAQLRLDKFKLMENHGMIGDTFSAIALSCSNCYACIPLRINLQKFVLDDRLQRVKKVGLVYRHNLDFPDPVVLSEHKSEEYFNLFSRYVRTRHQISKMASFNCDDFRSFILPQNRLLSVKDQSGKLVAAASIDVQYDPSLYRSMHFTYAFYDTDQAYKNKSLGTLLWALGVEHALHQKLDYIYVGAGAVGSPKLGYKLTYPGLETFVDGKWVDYNPLVHISRPDHSSWLANNTIDLSPKTPTEM